MASSIKEVERVAKVMRVLAAPAALVVAISPSECARPGSAVGAIKIGIDTGLTQNGGAHVPNAHVDQHVWEQRESLVRCLVLAQRDLVISAAAVVVVCHLGQQLASAGF